MSQTFVMVKDLPVFMSLVFVTGHPYIQTINLTVRWCIYPFVLVNKTEGVTGTGDYTHLSTVVIREEDFSLLPPCLVSSFFPVFLNP